MGNVRLTIIAGGAGKGILARKKRRHGEGTLYRRKDSPYWYMGYRVGGRQRNESTGTANRRVAQRILAERLLEVQDLEQANAQRAAQGWLFKDVAEEAMRELEAAGTLGPKTLADYRRILDGHLLPVFGNDFLHQLRDSQRFQRYAAAKRTGRSPKTGEPLPTAGRAKSGPLAPITINHHLAVLRAVFDYAQRQGVILGNPMDGVRSLPVDRDEPRPLEREEVEALLAAIEEPDDRLATLIMVALGLRIGEVFALKRKDFVARDRLLRIRRTVRVDGRGKIYVDEYGTKTRSGRRDLRMSEALAAQIAEQLERHDAEWILPSERGTLRHPGNYRRRVFYPACEAAGIEATPHDLRDTFASEQISAGVAPTVLAYRMGHASPQVTLTHYADIFRREQETEADNAALYEVA